MAQIGPLSEAAEPDGTGSPGSAGRHTIREIAAFAGVSTATVSRVVNGSGYVSPATRRNVERVVGEHGYTANRSARGLSAGRTGLVGVTVPLIHPAYFSVIVAGVTEALYEQDMRIVLCPTLHEHDREVSLLERLMHGTTDGGLLVLPEESSGELRTLMTHGFRFVVVDPRSGSTSAVPTVSAAHSSGADQATTPPARARPPPDRGDHRAPRLDGDRGATARLSRGACGRRRAARPAARRRVELRRRRRTRRRPRCSTSPEPPTAIFAFNDQLAIGAMQARSSAACVSPKISRSSASTTPPRPRSSRPR